MVPRSSCHLELVSAASTPPRTAHQPRGTKERKRALTLFCFSALFSFMCGQSFPVTMALMSATGTRSETGKVRIRSNPPMKRWGFTLTLWVHVCLFTGFSIVSITRVSEPHKHKLSPQRLVWEVPSDTHKVTPGFVERPETEFRFPECQSLL